MLKKTTILLIIPAMLFLSLAVTARSQIITLHVPIVEETMQQHRFYHELLSTAIEDIGHTPNLIEYRLPQLRIKNYLQHGILSLYWMVESKQRNENFIPIEVGLTNKLIGKRVLLINKKDQHLYQNVNNLEDFRNLNLKAKMGKNWFDADVWKKNNLAYDEQTGSWKKIFYLIAQGTRHHYFPRGVNEILVEVEEYPDLAIEKRLLLIYDRDFRFYLSKEGVNAGSQYEKVLKQALEEAQKSGLIDRLIAKYWGEDFKKLNYENRVKIYLQSP